MSDFDCVDFVEILDGVSVSIIGDSSIMPRCRAQLQNVGSTLQRKLSYGATRSVLNCVLWGAVVVLSEI